jgi:hypothetical protein
MLSWLGYEMAMTERQPSRSSCPLQNCRVTTACASLGLIRAVSTASLPVVCRQQQQGHDGHDGDRLWPTGTRLWGARHHQKPGKCAIGHRYLTPKWWTALPSLVAWCNRDLLTEIFFCSIAVSACIPKGHHGIHDGLECGCGYDWCRGWCWHQHQRKIQIGHC